MNEANTDGTVRHVGYLGMGIMGSRMAANLLKAGFQVTVWNRTASRCEPLKAQGAGVADSPAALAAMGPQVICLNVSDTPDVEAVLFGKDGVAAGAKSGLVVVDHSTISPAATVDFAGRLSAKGVTFMDAPVSGGDVGAAKGTLSIMVGGDAATFERIKPMFEAMGKAITLVGEVGAGQVCKACNQVAVSCALMGVCEAIGLARQSGLDVQKMVEVVSAGAGGSWQLANLGPRIARGDHAPGFMIDLMLKDLGIVLDAGKQQGVPMHGTQAADRYFKLVRDQEPDGGRLGTQGMARALEREGNFRIAPR